MSDEWPLATMRALSVRQPAAELIVSGVKPYEVRSRRTHFRGRVLIHASMGLYHEDLARAGFVRDELDRGMLVGSVEIVGCVPFEPAMAEEMRPSGSFGSDWQAGWFAWVLRNPARLRAPVRLPGRLGLFKVPGSLVPDAKLPRSKAPAAHFVQYHKVDASGLACGDIRDNMWIVTNMAPQRIASTVIGSTVWLITGEKRPSRYTVCLAFIAEDIRESDISGFKYRVSGPGKSFEPFRIDDEPWFREFMSSQGNFAFGLNRIASEYVPHFARLARRARR